MQKCISEERLPVPRVRPNLRLAKKMASTSCFDPITTGYPLLCDTAPHHWLDDVRRFETAQQSRTFGHQTSDAAPYSRRTDTSTIPQLYLKYTSNIPMHKPKKGRNSDHCEFHFLAVQVIFICVYITNYLHFFTMFLSF